MHLAARAVRCADQSPILLSWRIGSVYVCWRSGVFPPARHLVSQARELQCSLTTVCRVPSVLAAVKRRSTSLAFRCCCCSPEIRKRRRSSEKERPASRFRIPRGGTRSVVALRTQPHFRILMQKRNPRCKRCHIFMKEECPLYIAFRLRSHPPSRAAYTPSPSNVVSTFVFETA